MAFALRRPFVLASAVSVATKGPIKSTVSRAFHTSKPNPNFFTSKPASPLTSLARARNAFQQSRTYMGQPHAAPQEGNLMQRLLYGGAIVGGTVLAINLIFNRETREDGGMPNFERAYLNDTFLHTGLGVGIIGVAASAIAKTAFTYRMMATNPWIVMGVGLAASIGTMYGTMNTDPRK